MGYIDFLLEMVKTAAQSWLKTPISAGEYGKHHSLGLNFHYFQQEIDKTHLIVFYSVFWELSNSAHGFI